MCADLKVDIHSLKARKLHDLESKETNAQLQESLNENRLKKFRKIVFEVSFF